MNIIDIEIEINLNTNTQTDTRTTAHHEDHFVFEGLHPSCIKFDSRFIKHLWESVPPIDAFFTFETSRPQSRQIKSIDRRGFKTITRVQDGGRKMRMMHRIRVVLCFKAESKWIACI